MGPKTDAQIRRMKICGSSPKQGLLSRHGMSRLSKRRMQKRSKEEQEEFLVREFLDQQNATVHKLERLADRIPEYDSLNVAGPDIWVKLDWQGNSLEVAFEVTDYYLDSGAWGSSSMRRMDIWHDVINHLPDDAAFKKLHVNVWFSPPAKLKVANLAEQLASFLLSHLPTGESEVHYSYGDFEQHPLLKASFKRIAVRNTSYESSKRLWHCDDFAIIGVSPAEIARIVREKTDKFPNYNLADADESWLLICAGGKSSNNRAGPLAALNEEVLMAGDQTPFHKVILWDRIDAEYVEIGPRS